MECKGASNKMGLDYDGLEEYEVAKLIIKELKHRRWLEKYQENNPKRYCLIWAKVEVMDLYYQNLPNRRVYTGTTNGFVL